MRPDFRQVIDAVVQSAQYESELEPNPVSNPELMKKITLYLDLRASEVVKFLRPNLRFWWQKNTHDFKNIIKKKIHAKKIKPSSNSHKVPQNTSQPSKPRKAEADSKDDPQTKPHKKKQKKATDNDLPRSFSSLSADSESDSDVDEETLNPKKKQKVSESSKNNSIFCGK